MGSRREQNDKIQLPEIPEKELHQGQTEEQTQEYIILNRQEEDGSGEPVRRLADYNALAQYQYFDARILQKDMRLTQAIRQKGKKLYEDKKVRLQSLESGYVEGRNEVIGDAVGDGMEGRISFPLHIVFNREEVLFTECQCEECRRHYYTRYYRKEYCAYLAAFLILVGERLQQENLGYDDVSRIF